MGKGLGIAGLVTALMVSGCGTWNKIIQEPPYRLIEYRYEETDSRTGIVYSVIYDKETQTCSVWETPPVVQKPYTPRQVDTRTVDAFYKERLLKEHCPEEAN